MVDCAIDMKIHPTLRYIAWLECGFPVLRTMDLNTLEIKTVVGRVGSNTIMDGIGSQGTFFTPTHSLAFSPDGTKIFVGDGSLIRVITVANWQMTTLVYGTITNGVSSGYADGPANVAMFTRLRGLTVYCYSGATACTGCAAGAYGTASAASSASVCQNCGAGAYSTAIAATSPDTCALCEPGAFNPTVGASSSGACALCGVGLYSNRTGASACAPCAAGAYNNRTGASACAGCPDYTQGPEGATAIYQCAANAGYFARYTRTVRAIVTMPAAEYDAAAFLAQMQAAAGPGATVTIGPV